MSIVPLLLIVTLTNPPGVVSQPHVDALWDFVQTLAGYKDPPPLVYFTNEEEPPVTWKFLAFYYEHTRVIRVGPRAWRQGLYSANANGQLSTGSVYLVIGHEMLHYALMERVPVEKHHCFFVQQGYRQRIAEFLVQNGIGHGFLLVMRDEENGCEGPALSSAEHR